MFTYFADYYCNFVLRGCVKLTLQFLQIIYEIHCKVAAILFCASNISEGNLQDLIFKKEICESIFPH
jgi:hypothetical protein